MKRALLVGVDRYDGFTDLSGCVADANALFPLLARNEDRSRNLDCKVLTERATRAMFLRQISELLSNGADFALLYFAGHGIPVNGDVALVTSDGDRATPGVRFTEVLEQVKNSKVNEVVIMLDCCFSGGAGTIPALDGGAAMIRSGMSVLTAARSDQVSMEFDGRGRFSTHVESALEGGSADVLGQVTIAGLYAYLSESFGAWEQRPTFKANIDRLHTVRRCRPVVPLDSLQQLPTWFPTPNAELPLGPSYEPDARPHDPEHEAIFEQLQKCRAAKLVEPVGTPHMYYAAINSLSCRLTPLGKHYWNLAKNDRI
ncbi:caspase family protein [Kibdelosporangium aridum]|uniref:Caspase domain-containing protein n=1 Tax=Kibdelosporangium aridum TaxID=2030 RepID=A0A1Y5X1Z3_KIBAR|nr:caspase family protein [Kibdelosporangium aridum]SMC65677.1 Caspase domain-containing protein [Kibdelosporangium aridum]